MKSIPDLSENAERKHFEAISDHYYDVVEAFPTQLGYFHVAETSEVERAFVGQPTMRLLDAGCGPGRHSVALAKAGHQVVSVDFANAMLRATQSLAQHENVLERVLLVQADVRMLPFRDDCIDGGLCLEVVEHLPGDLSQVEHVLSELGRIVRASNGPLLLETPLSAHHEMLSSDTDLQVPWDLLSEDIRRIYEQHPLTKQNTFTEEVLVDVLALSGWSVAHRRYIRVIPASLIDRFPFLHTLDRILEQQPLAQRFAREVVLHLQRVDGQPVEVEGEMSTVEQTSGNELWQESMLLAQQLHAQKQSIVDHLNRELDRFQEENQGLHARILELANNIDHLQRDLITAQSELEEAKSDRADLNLQVLDQIKVVEGLQKDLMDTQDELTVKKRETTHLQDRLEKELCEVENLGSKLVDAKERMEAQDSVIADQQVEISAMSNELTVFHERFIAISRDVKSLQGQLADRNSLAAELHAIHSSRYWRMLSRYWRMRQLASSLGRRLPATFRRWVSRVVTLRDGDALPIVSEEMSQETRPLIAEEVPWNGPASKMDRYDVIVLPIIDWDFRFQRPQQLARQFARNGHRVFYIRTKFREEDIPEPSMIEDRIYSFSLLGEPKRVIYQEAPSEAELDVFEASLSGLAQAASICEAVCLVQLPFWGPLAERLKRRFGWKVVYDCMDDHHGFDSNHPRMLALEERLFQICDLALATSLPLYRKCARLAKRVLQLPNAADLNHFSQPMEDWPVPPEIVSLAGPVIGYMGAISAWFDFDLLRHAPQQPPEWNFVLIGSTWDAERHHDLERKPNVFFLGEKPYDELPAYLAQMDAACIPFKITPITRSTDPVKLYEYLAAGLPVVASPLPELERFKDWVQVAGTPEEFTRALETALERESPGLAQERKKAVRVHTWARRFYDLHSAIADLFGRVSVILLTWNSLDLTKGCLESLQRTTTHPDVELILVDNGSTDGTPAYLRSLAEKDLRVKLVLNEENRGFAAAINQGLEVSSGDYVVLLNNDIVLTRGWLTLLLARLDQDPSIGLIGPTTNSTWNEVKVEPGYDDLSDLETFAIEHTRRYSGQVLPVSMLAMYCIAGKRTVFEKVGPLDERYEIGMFEDDDYALRVRAAGFRLVCARDVYVHHHGMAGFKQLGDRRYRKIFNDNRERFQTKWALSLQRRMYTDLDITLHQANALEELLEAHSDATDVVVIPPTIGWDIPLTQRPHQLAHAFARRGYLTLFCEDSKGLENFESLGENLYLAQVPAPVLDRIPTPIVLALPYNRAFVLHLRDPRVIYEVIDSLEVFPYDQETLEASHNRWLEEADVVSVTAKNLWHEIRVVRPDAVLCPNGVEYAHFSGERKGVSSELPDDLAPLVAEGKPIIGYHGALARWFDFALLRSVAIKRSDLSFVLIGPDHDGSFKRSRLKYLTNIHWLGPHPYSMLPHYIHQFDVALIPFTPNTITQATSPLKLYEYLAAGLPVVTTDLSECHDIPGVYVAKTEDTFLKGIDWALQAVNDSERRTKAQEFAKDNTWDARVMCLLDALDQSGQRYRSGQLNRDRTVTQIRTVPPELSS